MSLFRGWYPVFENIFSCSALGTNDEFSQLKALQLLSAILSTEAGNISEEVLNPILSLLTSLIQSSNANKLDIAVQCLGSLLARSEIRLAVWSKTEILPRSVLSIFCLCLMLNVFPSLAQILRSNPVPQMVYQIGFCLWLFTFETPVAENINR